jgi:signal transduction histidine kinase/CheY-like chemotaxis protein
MNLNAAIAIAAATLFAGQAAVAIWTGPRARVNQLAAALAIVLVAWAVGAALQLVAPSAEEARFWWRFSAVGFMWGGAFLWHFALELTEHRGPLGRQPAVGLVYFVGLCLWVWFISSDVLIARFVHQPFGWHFVFAEGIGPYLFVAYYGATTTAAIGLIAAWGWRSGRKRQRRQAQLIVLTSLPCVAVGTMTNLLLPLLGVHDLPPAAPSIFALWGLGFLFAVARHRLIRLSPALAAQDIFRASGESMLLLDEDRRVVAANPASARLLRRPSEQLLGRQLEQLSPTLGALPLEVQGGEQRVELVELATAADPTSSLPGGGGAVVDLSYTPVLDELGQATGWALMLRDVSESDRLQRQLVERGKLEAVGQLAAGVAHDFNNLLTAILAYAPLLRQPVDAGRAEEVNEAGEVIEQAARRAAELTGQLLAFGRGGKHRVEAVDLHRCVDEVMQLLARTIDKQIAIERDLVAEPAWVRGDPGQLQQVLMNLALNARDAMPDGGTLRFSTSTVELDGSSAKAQQLSAGRYLRCVVADTGCGMDDATLARLFEPFFSTKEGGQGMGLAMAYGIVRNHGGKISASSRPEQGSQLKLLLPAAVEPVELPTAATSSSTARTKRAAAVLLVDDEAILRRGGKRLLSRLGHEVDVAASGDEAVAWLEAKGPGAVEIVLLDMVMPGMSGLETLRGLLAIDPQLRVMVCSGYDDDGRVQQLLDEGALLFLAKPYTLEELEGALDTLRALPRAD